MRNDLVVTRSLLLNADPLKVWEILTHPDHFDLAIFNCRMNSDWKQGSTITWRGNYQKRDVVFNGVVMDVVPGRVLKFSAFDPHGGNEGYPENYIHVCYTLVPRKEGTDLQVTLSNFNSEEMRAQIAAEEWDFNVLPRIRSLAEVN
ncbi:MAG TPA: SRPBCC domain-containing protein, partial [Chryseosolibacter sp.]|nr:SRPBCC domain-containing protein [Chryseosolibacter sp.]